MTSDGYHRFLHFLILDLHFWSFFFFFGQKSNFYSKIKKKNLISAGLSTPLHQVYNCAAINVSVAPVSWFSLLQVLDTRTTS